MDFKSLTSLSEKRRSCSEEVPLKKPLCICEHSAVNEKYDRNVYLRPPWLQVISSMQKCRMLSKEKGRGVASAGFTSPAPHRKSSALLQVTYT